jgi:hypothetical protein
VAPRTRWRLTFRIHLQRTHLLELAIQVSYVVGRRASSNVVALLWVMVLQGLSQSWLTTALAPEYVRILHEGVRLRARLPRSLAQRRALLDAHCPITAPLRALVYGYDIPTTTEELWDTGLDKMTRSLNHLSSTVNHSASINPIPCVCDLICETYSTEHHPQPH